MKDWKYLYAFVQGKGHIEDNIPCQDYCKVFQHKNYSICVVSDGAGSCEKSDLGSKKATEFTDIHFPKLIEQRKWHTPNAKIKSKEWHKVAIKGLRAIKEDLERVRIAEGCELKSLSCTIIIAIQFKTKLLLTHIGDGRAGYCNTKDEWKEMLTPYKGRYSNETVFITSNIWRDEETLDRYIESRIIEEKLKAFCLLTDGCENASFECYKINEKSSIPEDINKPFKEFFDENINVHIPNLIKAQKSQSELNEIWKSFLRTGNDTLKNESDDKSMILAVKIPA
ncbi:MAG: PP2C family serine/threonine-protein phosphatase [Ginsengibacter sp.]